MSELDLIQIDQMKERYPVSSGSFSIPFSKNFTFLIYNLLTLGLYGNCQLLVKQRDLHQLKVKKVELIQTAQRVIDAWKQQERGYVYLSSCLRSQPLHESRRIWDNLKTFRDAVIMSTPQVGDSYVRAGFHDVLYYMGLVLANYMTFGIYALYCHYQFERQIKDLKNSECFRLNQVVREKLIGENSVRFEQVHHEFDLELKRMEEIKNVQETDPQEADEERAEIGQRYEMVTVGQHVIGHQITERQGRIEILERENENLLRRNVELIGTRRETLAVLNPLKIAYEPSRLQKVALESQVSTLTQQISDARGLAARQGELTVTLRQEESYLFHLRDIYRQRNTLMPLAPLYVKRDEDGELPGAAGIDEDDDQARNIVLTPENRIHSDLVNGQRSSTAIMEQLLPSIVSRLEGCGVNLNSDRHAIKLAVYRVLALHLIYEAKLVVDDCHGYALILNNNGIKMFSSKPARVQSYEVVNGIRQVIYKTVLTKIDDFTPRSLEKGIDPVSIKWICHRLNEAERSDLALLLISDVHHHSYQTPLNNELIHTAKVLLDDMAVALFERFDESLTDQWESLWRK